MDGIRGRTSIFFFATENCRLDSAETRPIHFSVSHVQNCEKKARLTNAETFLLNKIEKICFWDKEIMVGISNFGDAYLAFLEKVCGLQNAKVSLFEMFKMSEI